MPTFYMDGDAPMDPHQHGPSDSWILTSVETPVQAAAFCAVPAGIPLSLANVGQARPDAQWLLLAPDGTPRARCSLWWRNTPPYPEHHVGLIGHYAATDPSAGDALLRHSCRELARLGCTLALGPMDGSTWRSYRLVTERGTEPPFFLEPNTPVGWVGHFTTDGFAPVAQYYSALNTDLRQQHPRLPMLAAAVAERGISIRCLDPANFEAELRRIYPLALTSFAGNLLYSPIAATDFADLYRPLLPYIQPGLTLLAEAPSGGLAGFLFALPNVQPGSARPDTFIIKTLAVDPQCAGLGLGTSLVARCHEHGLRLGYRRAIHALMHVDNRSGRISAHLGQPMRQYALFGRDLGGQP